MNHDNLLEQGRARAALGGAKGAREKELFARGFAHGVESVVKDPAKYVGAGGNGAARGAASLNADAISEARQHAGGQYAASIEQIDRDAIYAQWNSPKGKGQERPGDTR